MKRLIALRRISQFASIAIFASTFLAAMNHSAGLIPPGILFRIDPVITSVTSITGRFIAPSLLVSGIVLALTAVFGRFFCGWFCPMGTALDMAGFIIRKKWDANIPLNTVMRSMKFFVLTALVLASLAGRNEGLVTDPLVIMSNLITFNMALPNAAMFFIAFAPVFFIRRSWCRFLCPLGALYAIVSAAAPFRRIVSKKSCVSCGECHKTCRMGAIRKDASYVKSECILCMDCVYDCPGHSTRFGKPA